MSSIGSSFKPAADTTGTGPKQTGSIPNLKLSDGNEIPMLAFGLGTALSRKDSELVISCALTAIKAGYTHLDGAEIYGNEKNLGIAIKQSGVSRSDLFVTTKLWKITTDVKTAFDASLERLGLNYVDLYLVHKPQVADTPGQLQQVWAEVEAIHASGRARSIGVSNFLQPHLETILATAKTKPAVNQIEYHPYLQHGDLLEFHRRHGIATAAYGALTAVTKAAPGPVDDYYAAVARKYGVTEGDVALRWAMDQGVVAVTTSKNEQRLKAYLAKLPSFKLTPAEIQEISRLGAQKHFRGFFNDIYGPEDRR
ncbi:aldehyde reductase 1 [Hypoxylon sp. FL1284]|nr:aldehyde reductase 1 [Hypoxylon sp. FL1284]